MRFRPLPRCRLRMPMTDMPVVRQSRAESLRAHTRTTHARLDEAVMACGIFEARARFGRFLGVQYRFHAAIEPLYRREDLVTLLPDLASRGRRARIADDLHALGLPTPPPAPDESVHALPLPAALGWLYVAEGATLGGAVILKLASALGLHVGFGASHLAPHADGVAAHWRCFTAALDAIDLPPAQEDQVIDGARQAFTRVHHHLHDAFA